MPKRRKNVTGQRERIRAYLHSSGAASQTPEAYNKYAQEAGYAQVGRSTFYAALKLFREERKAATQKGAKTRQQHKLRVNAPKKLTKARSTAVRAVSEHVEACIEAGTMAEENAYLKWLVFGMQHGWIARFLREQEDWSSEP